MIQFAAAQPYLLPCTLPDSDTNEVVMTSLLVSTPTSADALFDELRFPSGCCKGMDIVTAREEQYNKYARNSYRKCEVQKLRS